MSRRLILLSTPLALGMVLLLGVKSSSPLMLDIIVRSVDLIANAPFALIFVMALLALMMGAGVWATVMGIRAHGKRVRISKRRRVRIH